MAFGLGAIGAIASGVGSLVSAFGASQNAKAMQDAYRKAAKEEDKLFTRQTEKLDTLISGKEEKLYDVGNIFDRFESTGAFGDTNTLKNLRKAQEDFSALAAGDFTAFEAQLRKSMSDSLIATIGSGAPVGTFAGLAADQRMNFRQAGLSQAVGVTEFLSNEANKLLGAEFGIMDQGFNTQYQMDRTRVTNKANYSLGQAGQTGVGTVAFGNALTQGGALINSYGQYQNNLAMQNRSFDIAQQQVDAMRQTQQSGTSYVSPYSNITLPPLPDFTSPSFGSSVPNLPSSYDSPSSPLVYPAQRRSDFFISPGSELGTRYGNQSELGVLPPLTYNSSFNTLSAIGARIARA